MVDVGPPKFKITFLVFVCLSFLTACEKTKKEMGLTRQSPDEFAVMKRAPLELPPNYSLKPPSPGTPRPQEISMDKKAQETIFGSSKSQTSSLGSAEMILLEKSGAQSTDPNIRAVIDSEVASQSDEEVPVAEKLLGITGLGGKSEGKASVVDAKAEAERLKQNQIEGKPLTEGETPSIED